MKMKSLLPIVMLLALAACGKHVETPPSPTPGGGTTPVPKPGQEAVPTVEYLQFNPSSAHDITCTYDAAAGTGREDEVFEPYKKVIGISDWDEIFLD